jgi:hypothetical protein
VVLTVVCDPDPDQGLPGSVDSQLYCADAALLGVRALATVTNEPTTRIFLERPICPAIPCFDDELETGTVTGWTADGPFTFAIDHRLDTVPTPKADPGAQWPSIQSAVPAIDRPAIKGAPAIVARRIPYPFCGQAGYGQPVAVANCFLAAVLDGRKAELLNVEYGTEGGKITTVFRFDGAGSIHAFVFVERKWFRVDGGLVINPDAMGWSFDGWDGQTNLN